MSPDKDRCLRNIYTLAKKKGLRIGDLETACGVSVGYLARLRQDRKQTLPGSEFLFHAARLLETSVDNLLYFDFQLAAESDKVLDSFISKLICDTVTDRLSWRPDPACIPSPYISDKSFAFPDHPLLGLDPDLMQSGKSRETYLSPFHPAAADLFPRSAWRAGITADTDVLVVRVSQQPGKSEGDVSREEIELYLYNMKQSRLSALCHTNAGSPGVLDHALFELAEAIEETFRTRPLEQWALDAINGFLSGRRESD